MEAAIARLGGDTSDDVTPNMHGSQKSQTHLASHNYLTSEQWDFLQDETKSLKLKQTYLSKVWLKWGLRFPSAPTFRSGLALLMVSSKCDCGDPVAAYQHLQSFTTEFRKLRGLYPGEPSVKKFHEDPGDFKKIHPTLLGEYVECRVNVADILETSHKRATPCKRSNSSLAGSSSMRPSASPSSSSDSSRDNMMLSLLQFALQGGNNLQLSPPSADRKRRPAALTMSPGPAPKALKLQAIEDRQPPQEHRVSEEAASLMRPAPGSEEGDEEEEPADLEADQVAQQTAAFIAARKEKNKREKEKEQAQLAKKAADAAANRPGAACPIKRRIYGKKPASMLTLSVLTKQREAAKKQKTLQRGLQLRVAKIQ